MSAVPLIDNIRPLDFVRPGSIAELGDLVRRAAAENLGLFPIGGQTELHLGLPPNKPGIAVDLTHFDQVIDYPARDMTITVQAGITVGKLQALLAAENQRLPIDAPDNATLGGIIATNASGPRRYGCGTLRDYVIGISFMNDEGQEVKAGGRVVKNVAGYDLCKLHIGALGTMGIVTQVTVKLTPRPEANTLLYGHFCVESATAFLQRAHASSTRPICIELFDYTPSKGNEISFMIGYEGSAESVAWQTQQVQKELRAEFFAVEPARKAIESDWDNLKRGMMFRGKHMFKVSLLSSALPDFIGKMRALPNIIWQSHAGNGIVLGNYHVNATLDQASRILTELRQAAVAAQGNLIITRCPPAWKRELLVWGEPRGDRALMRKVKQALDPRDLFNPGRFLV